MKKLKALDILQRDLANMSISNPMERLSISGYEVIDAISELKALQAPKTCETCDHYLIPSGDYKSKYCSLLKRHTRFDFGCVDHSLKAQQ